MSKYICVIIVILLLKGCSITRMVDIRQLAYSEYVASDDFSECEFISEFSHIAEVESQGKLYYVISMVKIVHEDPGDYYSPYRKLKKVLIYNEDIKFVCELPYCGVLWNDKHLLYLRGAYDAEGMCGNIWDFSEGVLPGERKLIEKPVYGSYRSEETLK